MAPCVNPSREESALTHIARPFSKHTMCTRVSTDSTLSNVDKMELFILASTKIIAKRCRMSIGNKIKKLPGIGRSKPHNAKVPHTAYIYRMRGTRCRHRLVTYP